MSLIWKTSCGCCIRRWILSQEGLENEDSGESRVLKCCPKRKRKEVQLSLTKTQNVRKVRS